MLISSVELRWFHAWTAVWVHLRSRILYWDDEIEKGAKYPIHFAPFSFIFKVILWRGMITRKNRISIIRKMKKICDADITEHEFFIGNRGKTCNSLATFLYNIPQQVHYYKPAVNSDMSSDFICFTWIH